MERFVVDLAARETVPDSPFSQNTMPALAVSVSRASDGSPVTSLRSENFRVTLFRVGKTRDVTVAVDEDDEAVWETADAVSAGMYLLRLFWRGGDDLAAKQHYYVGVQARTFDEKQGPGRVEVTGQGQNVTWFRTPSYGPKS